MKQAERTNPFGINIQGVDHNDFERLCYGVIDQLRERGFEPDIIVTPASGGFYPARRIGDMLARKTVTGSYTEISYNGTERGEAHMVFGMNDSGLLIPRKKVLWFDDVADSGHSVARAKSNEQFQAASEFVTATLHAKHLALSSPETSPDIYAEQTEKWITYLWEPLEGLYAVMKALSKTWGNETLSMPFTSILTEYQRQAKVSDLFIERLLADLHEAKGLDTLMVSDVLPEDIFNPDPTLFQLAA
jgi:hypoxanthine phosphoribosyltransferase